MKKFHHELFASGRWFMFTFEEQMGNIGSEVSRALKAGEDRGRLQGAIDRGLELFELTLSDPQWDEERLREVARTRDYFCDAVEGAKKYGITLDELDRYFYRFALAARADR